MSVWGGGGQRRTRASVSPKVPSRALRRRPALLPGWDQSSGWGRTRARGWSERALGCQRSTGRSRSSKSLLSVSDQPSLKTSGEVRRLKTELPSCRGSEGVMGNSARRPQRGVDPCSSRGSLVIPPPRRPASHPHPRVPASDRAGSHCKVIFLSNDAV